MNPLALYANSFLWLYLMLAYERRGNAFAHKVRVMMSMNFGCRCQICHPREKEVTT